MIMSLNKEGMHMITQFRSIASTKLFELPALVRRAWRLNRPLTFTGLLMLAVFVGTLMGLVLDPRVITGVPAWLKPAKFAISIAIYSFTFIWILSFVRGHSRLVGVAANVTALAFLIEILIIVGQAARGTTSHFNVGTPLDAALFGVMGVSIVVLWLMGMLAALLLLRQRLPNPAFAWSLRLGVVVSLVGMGLAFLMTGPTPAQQASLAAGASPSIIGAHSVGVPDGGPGLPILGWSTVGGDIRVAHFVGLHALQIVPLFGWLVARSRVRWLSMPRRVALVWIGGLFYLGLTMLLLWQALRGQSVVAPDATTILAGSLLVVASCIAAVAIVVQARRHAPRA
jgi:hypothetical protein